MSLRLDTSNVYQYIIAMGHSGDNPGAQFDLFLKIGNKGCEMSWPDRTQVAGVPWNDACPAIELFVLGIERFSFAQNRNRKS